MCCAGSKRKYFTFNGRRRGGNPPDAINVHLSVEAVAEGGAFADCTSLEGIAIPPSVRVIGARAFENCAQLRNVELYVGLEKIG
jgi:hypothetical protein